MGSLIAELLARREGRRPSRATRLIGIAATSVLGPAVVVGFAKFWDSNLVILVPAIAFLVLATAAFACVQGALLRLHPDEEWLTSLTINFLAAVRTTRAALPHMLDRGAGTIVTIASVNSFLPDPGVIDYCAAKAALANFCKALSKEVGPHGVRVNTVSPGPVSTGLWLGDSGVAATVAQASGADAKDVAAPAAAQSVTGRFTRPEEVADLVLLLASDRAGNVTGADFVIDGGLVTTL